MQKVAFIDADDTLWAVAVRGKRKKKRSVHVGIISECKPPFRLRDEVLIDSSGRCRVYLHPEARNVLRRLKDKGYATVVLSINYKEPVAEAIRAFNLPVDGAIADIDLNKDAVVETAQKVCKPEKIVVVDDMINYFDLPRDVEKYRNLSEVEEMLK